MEAGVVLVEEGALQDTPLDVANVQDLAPLSDRTLLPSVIDPGRETGNAKSESVSVSASAKESENNESENNVNVNENESVSVSANNAKKRGAALR